MNRDEKNLQTRRRIIDSALQEFGEKSYAEGSLNNICEIGGISKGIIYHYFRDKEELYLACVEECFTALTTFITRQGGSFTDPQQSLNSYLKARYRFFKENPNYCHIFLCTVLRPPSNLIKQIKEIKKGFNMQSTSYFKEVLTYITLRDNVTEEDAMEHFLIYQEMFNGYFQSKADENADLNTLIEDHEIRLSKMLNIMLYGIAKERIE